MTNAIISSDDSSFDAERTVAVTQGTRTTLYIRYDWADADADAASIHISYVTLDREMSGDMPAGGVGKTSGVGFVVSFDVPETDGVGVSALDLWIEDVEGHESNRERLNYTTSPNVPPPPPPPPKPTPSADTIRGLYEITFESSFGDTIEDHYDVSASGTRIGLTAHCDDPRNPINCYHMDNIAGILSCSPGSGACHMRVEDPPCTDITADFVLGTDGVIRIENGSKNTVTFLQGCTIPDSPQFPRGYFSGVKVDD